MLDIFINNLLFAVFLWFILFVVNYISFKKSIELKKIKKNFVTLNSEISNPKNNQTYNRSFFVNFLLGIVGIPLIWFVCLKIGDPVPWLYEIFFGVFIFRIVESTLGNIGAIFTSNRLTKIQGVTGNLVLTEDFLYRAMGDRKLESVLLFLFLYLLTNRLFFFGGVIVNIGLMLRFWNITSHEEKSSKKRSEDKT